MSPIPFPFLDPSTDQRLPRLDFLEALALGQALLELTPKDASPQLDRIAEKLERLLSEGEAMLITRRRESVRADRSNDLQLDAAADALWGTLRDRLDCWSVFEHTGLDGVLEVQAKRRRTVASLSQARKNAARARELAARLFGTDGLAFTQLPYPAQAKSMASILRLIDEDELASTIDELAGPELMVALVACQAQYETMVKSRMSRNDRKSGDFRVFGGRLRRAIIRYVNAVLTLLDEDDPESLSLVVTALRPIEVLRATVNRGAGRSATVAIDTSEAEVPAEPVEA